MDLLFVRERGQTSVVIPRLRRYMSDKQFKEGLIMMTGTLLSGDLALAASRAPFERVRESRRQRYHCSYEGGTGRFAARRTCLVARGDGAWWPEMEFDVDPPIPVIMSKAPTSTPNPGEPQLRSHSSHPLQLLGRSRSQRSFDHFEGLLWRVASPSRRYSGLVSFTPNI